MSAESLSLPNNIICGPLFLEEPQPIYRHNPRIREHPLYPDTIIRIDRESYTPDRLNEWTEAQSAARRLERYGIPTPSLTLGIHYEASGSPVIVTFAEYIKGETLEYVLDSQKEFDTGLIRKLEYLTSGLAEYLSDCYKKGGTYLYDVHHADQYIVGADQEPIVFIDVEPHFITYEPDSGYESMLAHHAGWQLEFLHKLQEKTHHPFEKANAILSQLLTP